MQTYKVLKGSGPTSDGYFVYNFTLIPQSGYIKTHNMFYKNDKPALMLAIKMLKAEGLLPAYIEVEDIRAIKLHKRHPNANTAKVLD